MELGPSVGGAEPAVGAGAWIPEAKFAKESCSRYLRNVTHAPHNGPMRENQDHTERCITHATLVAWENGAESTEEAREWALMALVESDACTCE